MAKKNLVQPKNNQKTNLIKYTALIIILMYSYLVILIHVNTCNNNEKSIIDYGLCNSKLTSMISRVIQDEPQEYKLKGKKYSDHNTFIIDINTKTKHLEMVGKSVWKINEKTDWRNYKELLQTKYKIMTGTQKIAQNTLKK